MKKSAYHFLRVGMAITFMWIGVLILRSPGAWAIYIQPWALSLLPIPLVPLMIATAVLDIVVGICLLFDFFVWAAALLGAIHILMVLITSGVNDVTVRDVGLFTGALALFLDALPGWVVKKCSKGHDSAANPPLFS